MLDLIVTFEFVRPSIAYLARISYDTLTHPHIITALDRLFYVQRMLFYFTATKINNVVVCQICLYFQK